ncbi:replication initiation protein [Ilyobacter sp.]|uniref:replication initiation protein n=1 Tax=Ilyobacter sp. TaxID=3100343 RepID=UPI00356A699B
MEQNQVVVHHNNLTESIFSFNELELNTFIVLIYKLRNGNRKAIFDAKDIKKLINSKNRSMKRFEIIVQNLFNTTINIKTDTGYKLKHFFEELEFNSKEKTISIEVKKEFEWLIYDLKEKFTKYSLHEFIELKGAQSKRLFQLLKQYENATVRTIEINQLKKWLGAESYTRIYDFEKRVLIPSVNNLNENASININYEKIKQGRNITHIKFTIFKTKKTTASNKIEVLPASDYEKESIKIIKSVSRLREEAQKTLEKQSITRNEFEKMVEEYTQSGLTVISAEKFLRIKYSIID